MIMTIFLYLFLLLASVAVLARSSVLLIKSLTNLAGYFRLPNFSVAFLFMATVTSFPEMFVGISAALENAPTLALGNVLGANIILLTLVFGVVLIVGQGVHSHSVIARKDALYMFLSSLAPGFLLIDGILSRGDAVVLLIFYGLYVMRLLEQKSAFHETIEKVTKRQWLESIAVFVVGTLLLFFASQVLVFAAKNIAATLDLAIGLVGLFLVALGTSTPELVFSIRTARKEHDALLFGDLIGSVVTNSTLVLAVTSFIRPIIIPDVSLYIVPGIFLATVLVLFEVIVRQNKQLGTLEGVVLVFIYILFVLTELSVGFLTHAM